MKRGRLADHILAALPHLVPLEPVKDVAEDGDQPLVFCARRKAWVQQIELTTEEDHG